jgi:hypothetical protein
VNVLYLLMVNPALLFPGSQPTIHEPPALEVRTKIDMYSVSISLLKASITEKRQYLVEFWPNSRISAWLTIVKFTQLAMQFILY